MAILGVIATFTIPKVLQSQQDTKSKSIAKETASMVSEAYSAYKNKTTPTSSFGLTALTPYLNYVKLVTTGVIDGDARTVAPSIDCSDTANYQCLRLHNGGILTFFTAQSFGGTSTTHAVSFGIDTDGKQTTSTVGEIPQQGFMLYINGRLTTSQAGEASGGCTSFGCAPLGALDAPWFNWN
jgi:type II secretory pathway pseudopilin PulG